MCHVVLEYLFNELKQSAMRKSRGRKKVIVILIEKEHYYMYSCYMRFGATLMCGTISVYVTLVYVIHHTHMNVQVCTYTYIYVMYVMCTHSFVCFHQGYVMVRSLGYLVQTT